MSRRISNQLKAAVIKEYHDKVLTVDQIVQKYGIARRTVYSWVSACHGRENSIPRKALYLSQDETETILLLMMEAGDSLKGKYKAVSASLENRLLNLADNFTEESKAKEF